MDALGQRLRHIGRAFLYYVVLAGFCFLVAGCCFFWNAIDYVVSHGAVPANWRNMWAIPPSLVILPLSWIAALTAADVVEVMLIAVAFRFEKMGVRDLLRVKGARPWLTCAGCVLATLTLLVASVSANGVPPGASGDGPGPMLVVASVAFALPTAVSEELLYRGLLLHTVAKGAGFLGSTVIVTAMFALVHAERQRPLAILLGLLFAWTTRRSGSVTPSILAHFANNAMVALGVAGLWPGWTLTPPLAAVLMAAALLAVHVGSAGRDASHSGT